MIAGLLACLLPSQLPAALGEPIAAPPPGALLAALEACPDRSGERARSFSLLGALEASRQPQDLGINANFGAALAANAGFALGDGGFGAQLGAGQNLSHAGVKVLRVAEGTTSRTQTFVTAGLFQRRDDWHWGLGFDWQRTQYYRDWSLGQLRLDVGRALGAADEGGMRAMAPLWSERFAFLGAEFQVRTLAQGSIYWRHWWSEGGATTFWLGAADRHGTDILTLPDRHLSKVAPVFGLEVFIPLNDHLALFGQGNFVTPPDTGTLDAFLGFEWFPGGGLTGGGRGGRAKPALAVANNPTMSVDLRRR